MSLIALYVAHSSTYSRTSAKRKLEMERNLFRAASPYSAMKLSKVLIHCFHSFAALDESGSASKHIGFSTLLIAKNFDLLSYHDMNFVLGPLKGLVSQNLTILNCVTLITH